MAKIISSKHLEGVSDLTLSAPIKQGFIHAFESVTYETRVRLLLKALSRIRQSAREYTEIKPFVDTSERIQSLLDFRLAVLEDTQPRRLLLTATFDRPFEPYMRLIWRPLGTLLDVIFCNCDGYVTATENSFEDYLGWVRRSQIDTDFFWAMSGQSIDDYQYVMKLDRLERLRARGEKPPPQGEMEAKDWREAMGAASALKVDTPAALAQAVRAERKPDTDFLGLEALVSLYRLTDFYPPDQPDGDGELLRQAARQLLDGWDQNLPASYENELLLKEQLRWFRTPIPRSPRKGTDPAGRPLPERKALLPFDEKAVQGGIVAGYGDDTTPVRQGAVLLLRITDAAKARRYLAEIGVRSGDPAAPAPADGVYRNLAFTRHGLSAIGIADDEIARFPQEFREGMEERAGLLGDLRQQHPRRWRLPARNWPPRPAGERAAATGQVELSEVDLVVQLRTLEDHEHNDSVGDASHPLHPAIRAIADAQDSGVELLSVETLQRASRDDDAFGRDHFGFRDGFSQPKAVPVLPAGRDQVRAGEIFRGHPTDRGDPPPPESWLLDNGSFLVVRKLRQRVAELHQWAAKTAPDLGIDAETLFGLMVGRTRDGKVLRDGVPSESNEFDYSKDADGARCPFQAHIRRTNPRLTVDENHGRPGPRILRRGLSWGPRYVEGDTKDAARGIMFMAYCGSLAEQYEVIQRWVNGGNSTAIGSWLSDPLMGAPKGEKRSFRFTLPAGEDCGPGRSVTIELSQPFVELEWGAYLFVPSMAAIETIASMRDAGEAERWKADAAAAERGEPIVQRLLAMEAGGGENGRAAAAAAWKATLEDFGSKDPAEKARAPAVWAAIRQNHGGALRVPYPDSTRGGEARPAVLVAGKQKVMQVFGDPHGHYSMCGQMERMKQSFGEIFLGRDGGPEYDRDAQINPVIYAISEERAFAVARQCAAAWMQAALGEIGKVEPKLKALEIDLRRHFITPVLGLVCNAWFDIPDDRRPGAGKFVNLDGWSWTHVDARKPTCPGDYMATSRYCFYPDPAPAVQAYGQAQGKALRTAVRSRFQKLRSDGFPPSAPLALALSKLYPDDDHMARTLIGVMTGFLPPTDGSLRWSLYEWLEEKTYWRIQHAYLTGAGGSEYERAKEAIEDPLKRAMQKRPSPDLLWRTAKSDHMLGGVEVREGDKMIIGIVSAMAQDVASGVTDVYPVFGGRRRPADAADPGPLHACPAYKFAMGTMLGMLSVLFDGLELRALPAPLLVEIKPRPLPGAGGAAVGAASAPTSA